MTTELILLVLGCHFVGDYLLQSDWMALNKSKDNKALSLHTLVYSMPFVILGYFYSISILWFLLLPVLHFVVDYISSRITSKFWKEEKRHWFFVIIGLDNYIHFCILFITLKLLMK